MFRRHFKRLGGRGAHDFMEAPSTWLSQQVLSDGDSFFNSLIEGIGCAVSSIELEAYIFSDDELGRRIEGALIEAKMRGVRVRVMVDGVGSQGWFYSIGKRMRGNGIEIKVYHPLPWEALPVYQGSHEVHPGVLKLFSVINRRNHRKVCVVDSRFVWLGSLNIWEVTVPSLKGDDAWRELGIKLEGDGAHYVRACFDFTWYPRGRRFRRLRRSAKKLVRNADLAGIRANVLLPSRLWHYQELIHRINHAERRLWIVNAYFVPARSLIDALGAAARRGVDVRVLTPLHSDVKFMPWVAHTFLNTLKYAGVTVYGYSKCILHAKYMIIDDVAIIGSSNLNHRSLIHDLELDLLTSNKTMVEAVAKEFERDISVSQELSEEKLGAFPLWQRYLGKIALLFKYYL